MRTPRALRLLPFLLAGATASAHEAPYETGAHQSLFPATSYEIGGGLDLGLEFHVHRGIYVALVLGLQVTAAFNVGVIDPTDGMDTPQFPSWPVALTNQSPILGRIDTTSPSPNLNLLRIGLVL